MTPCVPLIGDQLCCMVPYSGAMQHEPIFPRGAIWRFLALALIVMMAHYITRGVANGVDAVIGEFRPAPAAVSALPCRRNRALLDQSGQMYFVCAVDAQLLKTPAVSVVSVQRAPAH